MLDAFSPRLVKRGLDITFRGSSHYEFAGDVLMILHCQLTVRGSDRGIVDRMANE